MNDSEQCSNRLECDLIISLLVNLSCELGQIKTLCDFLWATSYGLDDAWGALSQIEHLFKIQKKSIILINRKAFRAHTDPIFKRENVLRIHDLYKLHSALLIYGPV